MELRQLKYFYLVNQLHSVTKAAAELNIAQPAISISMHKLEEELGVTLFDRTQKQITLTPEGEVFLVRAEQLLKLQAETLTLMNDYKLQRKGSIKIGITPIIGASLFPYLFSKLQKAFPHFDLNFIEEGTLGIRQKLLNGDIDIGILITSQLPHQLEHVPITKGQLMACLASNHPLAKRSSIPLTELKNDPFILLNEDTYCRKIILDECAKYQISPQISFSTRHISTILGLVEQGAGVSFLLNTIADKHANIVTRPLENPLYIRCGLAWNKTKYLSNATKTFIDFVSDTQATEYDPNHEI